MASKLASTSASELIPSNASRKSIAILNEDTTDTIFVKMEMGELLTVSAIDHDWRLGPGGSLSLNSLLDGTQTIQSRFTMIATANTPRISVFDTEDIRR